MSDIKIMISSHAHVDHVGAHAEMEQATGARVMAVAEDAKALESGKDLSPVEYDNWPAVKVDRVLRDGDTVTLGGTTLRAVWTPGHTPGATTWVTTVQGGGRGYNVVFPGGGLLLRDRFPSIDRIHRIRSPLLVIAGEHDRIVPIQQSRRVYAAASAPKTLVIVPEADHNDYELLAGNEMIRAIVRFLQPLT